MYLMKKIIEYLLHLRNYTSLIRIKKKKQRYIMIITE